MGTHPPLILCFGDSLTAGFQSPLPAHPTGLDTPYGTTLQECLGPRATVVISGICGELTGEMVLRFSTAVLQRQPAYVVILGGSNDLGWNAQPLEIMRNLVMLYERAQGGGIVPVAVTVPSLRIESAGASRDAAAWVEDHLARRAHLNRLILDYARNKPIPYLDLFAATCDPGDQLLAAVYSNDGLHLSTEGYRLFGRLLYEQVFASRFTREAPAPS